ncbi:Ser/Thr protein phosphatase family [Metarhizium album ARSEF 1941]|uniref:Ser/Thr protein phosphatase family n=1 Tax=Metarhizium album (strain ARSEF 1941) TaxID=1081103 RepID=A0A0B2WVL7_METAS|nr:Ser/Thr protein phosphatase family [Metarhizium album ARSEF 1941]KHO00167.1 Ser/Thr protein phosphatase family [Metarhizium album ARSEF 1941]
MGHTLDDSEASDAVIGYRVPVLCPQDKNAKATMQNPWSRPVTLLATGLASAAVITIVTLLSAGVLFRSGKPHLSTLSRSPSLHDLTLIASLPMQHVPTVENGRRLLVIGDIHGMNTELGSLLDRAKYDAATDHVVALGDMVNKGPDSRGVLSRLMSLNASAVRGNHEDCLVVALKERTAAAPLVSAPDVVANMRKCKKKKILRVADTLLPEQVAWLESLPVILKCPSLRLYFVHGGLVPGIKLGEQDPWAVMNMRTLIYPGGELRRRAKLASAPTRLDDDDDDDDDSNAMPALKVIAIPTDDHSGERWDKAWNKYQKKNVKKAHRRTVMYGHDAKRGFREGRYTVGLDSACVAGGQLTALIVTAKRDGTFSYDKVQVPCKAARPGNKPTY